jgi:hypothetical protein
MIDAARQLKRTVAAFDGTARVFKCAHEPELPQLLLCTKEFTRVYKTERRFEDDMYRQEKP